MISPSLAAARFAAAVLMGMGLGLLYGFLRPLRPRLTLPADLLFLGAAIAAWIYLSFAVCLGEVRVSYTLGMILGMILWETTAGQLLRPVFSLFWLPLQKFLQFFQKFFKKLFASAKKWVTIYWSKHNRKHHKGGSSHGAHHTQAQTDPSGLPAEQSAGENGGAVLYRRGYGRPADPEPDDRRRPKPGR